MKYSRKTRKNMTRKNYKKSKTMKRGKRGGLFNFLGKKDPNQCLAECQKKCQSQVQPQPQFSNTNNNKPCDEIDFVYSLEDANAALKKCCPRKFGLPNNSGQCQYIRSKINMYHRMENPDEKYKWWKIGGRTRRRSKRRSH